MDVSLDIGFPSSSLALPFISLTPLLRYHPITVLIWEISGDMIDLGNGQIATPLIDATNAKILNPSLDCSGLRDPEWALSDQAYLYAPDEPDTVDWSNYIAPNSMGSANDFNGAQEEGQAIRDAVNNALDKGIVTEDLADGGTAYGTKEVGDWLAANI